MDCIENISVLAGLVSVEASIPRMFTSHYTATVNMVLHPQTQNNKAWFYKMGTSAQLNIQQLHSADYTGILS
jgi:hypothetical protein